MEDKGTAQQRDDIKIVHLAWGTAVTALLSGIGVGPCGVAIVFALENVVRHAHWRNTGHRSWHGNPLPKNEEVATLFAGSSDTT